MKKQMDKEYSDAFNGKPGAEQPPPDGNFQAGYEDD